MSAIGDLRFEPIQTRLRAISGGEVVADSTNALVVWEPKRVVPSYAVPVADVQGELAVAPERQPATERPVAVMLGGPPVLDPRTPFSVHTASGTSFDLRTPSGQLDDAVFRLDEPPLEEVVVLDFAGFDTWLEEEQEVVGHPHDPFHRIDVHRSSRHVEVRLGGETLALSTRAHHLSEAMLPDRFYIPRDDVRLDLLSPSPTRTVCAYKGHASYFSFDGSPEGVDIAWTYEDPLHDALDTAGDIAFFSERVDLIVDGVERERPVTPWS